MTDREQRVDQIRRAAIPVFASQGFKRTSMADLAEAAGVSRPRSTSTSTTAPTCSAKPAGHPRRGDRCRTGGARGDGLVAERIDGYLQRLVADGYETLYGMAFATEFLEANTNSPPMFPTPSSSEAAMGCGRSSPTRRRPVPPPARPPPSSCSSPRRAQSRLATARDLPQTTHDLATAAALL